jgi:hypothetical protein
MRVLITNERLDQRAGSDLFVRDLARGLQQLGHFVLAYGSDLRERERLLERDSIPVVVDLETLPFRPDVIHARHHLDAMTAVMALPGVPAVYHCTGLAWSIVLPIHPRIFRYIAPSPGVARWIEREGGIPQARVDVAFDAVDLLRFSGVREPRPQPARALVYDDGLLPDSQLVTEIRRAVLAAGLEFNTLGRRLGRQIDNPEARLPDFDIVFARGRNAIEGLACSCAVVVINDAACGEMVHMGNFERLRAENFTTAEDSSPASADQIAAELDRYSAGTSLELVALLRREADFVPFVEQIEKSYLGAIAMNAGHDPDLAAEQLAVADYLNRISPILKEMGQSQKPRGDIPLSTASMFLDVSSRLAAIQSELDKPQW